MTMKQLLYGSSCICSLILFTFIKNEKNVITLKLTKIEVTIYVLFLCITGPGNRSYLVSTSLNPDVSVHSAIYNKKHVFVYIIF